MQIKYFYKIQSQIIKNNNTTRKSKELCFIEKK
jgi:hypothetical protein